MNTTTTHRFIQRTWCTCRPRLKAGPWAGHCVGQPPQQADPGDEPRKPSTGCADRLGARWRCAPRPGCRCVGGRLRVLWPDHALMHVCPGDRAGWVSSGQLRRRWARCVREARRRRRHGGGVLPMRMPSSAVSPEADGRVQRVREAGSWSGIRCTVDGQAACGACDGQAAERGRGSDMSLHPLPAGAPGVSPTAAPARGSRRAGHRHVLTLSLAAGSNNNSLMTSLPNANAMDITKESGSDRINSNHPCMLVGPH